MKPNAKYLVIKPIPLKPFNGETKEIPINTAIYRTHGVYYMNGGLLSQAYQEDFDMLIEEEEKNGWHYLTPVTFTEYGL